MAISTLKYALLVWFLMLVTFVILYFPTNTAGVATSDRKDIAQNSNTTMLPRPLITKVHNAPQHDVQTRNIVAVTARISESDRKPSAIEPVPTVDAVQRQVASQLISLHKPASSDVRGNLGPVSCITNETVSDWLADRWQGENTRMEYNEQLIDVCFIANLMYTVLVYSCEEHEGRAYTWRALGGNRPTRPVCHR